MDSQTAFLDFMQAVSHSFGGTVSVAVAASVADCTADKIKAAMDRGEIRFEKRGRWTFVSLYDVVAFARRLRPLFYVPSGKHRSQLAGVNGSRPRYGVRSRQRLDKRPRRLP